MHDDGAGALVEQRAVGLVDQLGVTFAQPLRRQLHRRQRVLDLVRQPACYLAPGFHALDPQQLSDVLQKQRRTTHSAVVVEQHRRASENGYHLIAATELDLALNLAPRRGAQLLQQLNQTLEIGARESLRPVLATRLHEAQGVQGEMPRECGPLTARAGERTASESRSGREG